MLLFSCPCPSLWALKTHCDVIGPATPQCACEGSVRKAGLCSSDEGLLLGEVEVKASFRTTEYSRKERNLWEVLVKPSAIRIPQGPRATPGGSLVSGRLQAASLRAEADGAAAVPALWCLPWLHLLMCLLRACLTPFDFPHCKNGHLGACRGQDLTDSQG